MAKKSITKRWIVNNLGVVVLGLFVFDMIFIYSVQNYYYNSAKQYLISKINAVTSVLSIHSQDSSANFSSENEKYARNFQRKRQNRTHGYKLKRQSGTHLLRLLP